MSSRFVVEAHRSAADDGFGADRTTDPFGIANGGVHPGAPGAYQGRTIVRRVPRCHLLAFVLRAPLFNASSVSVGAPTFAKRHDTFERATDVVTIATLL